jgi:Big-like domain-containing protein
MRKSGFLCAVLLAAAACSGSDGTAPLVATSLSVSTSPAQISVNGTAQASAIVKDQNGNPLTGQTITWTSLTPAIASVDASTGVVKGLAAGTATIQGKSGSVTGTGSIIVIAPLASCVSGPVVVNLAVGQAAVVNAATSQGCIKISSATSGSQFLVIAANTNQLSDQLATFTLKTDTGEVVPNTTLLANPYRISANLAALSAPVPTDALQDAFESKLRLLERKELKIPDAQRAYRARGSAQSQIRTSLAAAIPNIGDKRAFKVPTSCTVFTTVTATAQYISNKAIIYLDDASPSGGFTATDYQNIANEFDNLIYPTDVSYFGNPLDLDNNGHIIILYTPQVNKLTPTGNPGSFVGGFFFVGDLFPATGSTSDDHCNQSNVGEIFYVLTPDPGGVIVPNGGGSGNPRSTASVRQGTRGTIAHEFQHMINASERIASPIMQDFEEVWLDEGLAHFAEDVNGRAQLGLADNSNATFETVSANLNDYSAFFFQNFARLDKYMVNPGPNSPTSFHADTSLADRGAIWSLLRYSADNYAPGGDIKAFTRALAGGPNTGVNNLVTRTGVPFDTLIAGWMIANYADDAGIPNLPDKYTYKSYNMRSNMSAKFISPSELFPLQINDVTTSSFVVSSMGALSGSGDYFRFTEGAVPSARSFRLLNPDGTAASFTGASFFILRTQ